jgi:mono/diheme cytochrome c family protein
VWLRFIFKTALAGLLLAALALAGVLAWGWRPEIAATDAQARPSFDAALVRKGGAPYAGGRAISTPFGIVFSTNITPDPDLGIGRWPESAFIRAMREGVSRDGRHLYPAFPYDHMTRMREEDIKAVYAFVMTRQPARVEAPANDLEFPFDQRALVAAWKMLFLSPGEYRPDRSKSEEWNRGGYLVEGLAHCGACHTPRNVLGAEKTEQAYAGGQTEGWIAPALDASSPAAVPWTPDRLFAYLREGRDALHGVATGPMAPVVRNLRQVSDADVRAITVYVADIAGAPSRERQDQAERIIARARGGAGPVQTRQVSGSDQGGQIYAGACAQCHGEAGRAPLTPALNLALSTPVRASDPANFLRIVLEGIHPAQGAAGPVMPGFGNVLSDEQLAALGEHVRASFSDRPPWTGLGQAVRQARHKNGS